MLTILEGPDGGGKTSLANRLRKDLKQYVWLVRSNGPPPNITDLTQAAEWLTSLSAVSEDVRIICDRFPLISEAVYGPILRGKCMHVLSSKQIAQYLMQSAFLSPLIVYCRPTYAQLEEKIHSEIHLEGVTKNLRHIVKAYDELMAELEEEGIYIKRYDYTGPPSLVVDAVRDHFNKGV